MVYFSPAGPREMKRPRSSPRELSLFFKSTSLTRNSHQSLGLAITYSERPELKMTTEIHIPRSKRSRAVAVASSAANSGDTSLFKSTAILPPHNPPPPDPERRVTAHPIVPSLRTPRRTSGGNPIIASGLRPTHKDCPSKQVFREKPIQHPGG